MVESSSLVKRTRKKSVMLAAESIHTAVDTDDTAISDSQASLSTAAIESGNQLDDTQKFPKKQRRKNVQAPAQHKKSESVDTATGPRGLVSMISNVDSNMQPHSNYSDSNDPVQATSSSSLEDSGKTAGGATTMSISAGVWANKNEMILTIVGFIGGFGDAWGFPFLSIKHGQGTFVIYFLLFHLMIALPLVYLEIAIGQYSSMSPVLAFANIVPVLQGVGWAAIFICAVRAIYYNVIMAWATFYAVANLIHWETCNYTFNEHCCINTSMPTNISMPDCANRSLLPQFAAHQLFYNYMYNYKDGLQLDGLGHLQWHLTLCLFFCWLVTLGCVIRGVASFGIIVYFSSIVPLIIMVIVAIFALSRENAGQGVTFLFTPNKTAIFDPQVFTRAGIHVLFSVSPAFGIWTSLGSYNSFTNNCFRDSLFTVSANAATSLTSGFTIASLLGFTASKFNVSIPDLIGVATASRDMAFVMFPQALLEVDGKVKRAVFNVLYYLMLMFIGLNTQFYEIEVVVIAICDQWPKFTRHRWVVASVLCLILFLLGLPMCTQQGLSLFTTMSTYSDTPLLYISLFELLSVIYIYGWRKLLGNIKLMVKQSKRRIFKWIGSTGKLMQWLWFAFSSPMLIVSVVLYVAYASEDNEGSRWINTLGTFLFIFPLAIIVVMAAWRIIAQLRINQPLGQLLTPTPDWAPIHLRPILPLMSPRSKVEISNQSATLVLPHGAEINRY